MRERIHSHDGAADREGSAGPRRSAGPRPPVPAPAPPGLAGPLALQRLLGNAAVSRLVEARPEPAWASDVSTVLRAPGRPLDPTVRADMESRLGADFSAVRVHTGASADASARALGAHAYTSGTHVVFQRGRYDTSSPAGRRMLAHELVHVVQQRNGPVEGTPTGAGYSLSHPDDRHERAAERTAAAAMSRPAPLQRDAGSPDDGIPARDASPWTGGAVPAVQRRVGFEFEDSAWRPWRRLRVDHGPVSGTLRRARNVVPSLDDDRVNPAERHAILHHGDGFRLEADDTPGPTESNIEFVTDAFEETAAGIAALDRALLGMGAIMQHLNGQTGRPGPRTDQGGPPYPLPAKDYKERFVRHEQHRLSGSAGLEAKDVLLSGGVAGGRFKMQATSGTPLPDLPTVMERLGQDVPGETAQQTTDRRAHRALINPPDDFKEYLRVQGHAPTLARQVVTQMRQDPGHTAALTGDTGALTGLLASVLLCLKLLRRPVGRGLGVKTRLSLMPRNSFAEMFEALPDEQRDAIRGNPAVMLTAVLGVSNANPLLLRGGDVGLTPGDPLIAENPGEVTGVDTSGALTRAPAPALEQALATVSIGTWITGIPAGHDYLLPRDMEAWLAGQAGFTAEEQADAVGALESFGSADALDTRNGTPLALFENRAISPRTDAANLTMAEAARNAHDLLAFFARVRAGNL